jgi:hypothetical protein
VVVNSLEDLEDWLAGEQEPELTQACSKCTAEHPVSHFRRTGPGGPFKRCEACRQPERRHERRLPYTPEQTRRSNLRRLYGISPEEYDALRAKQDYRCAICSRHEDELPDRKSGRPRLDGKPSTEAVRLQVDHDHDTNAIRGLLCWQCNTGIGCFQDQPDRMASAIAYVSR